MEAADDTGREVKHVTLEPSPTEHEILRAIRRIVQSISIHSKQMYRQTGLTVPQLLCLRALASSSHEEVTAAEVAREVQLSPATVTGILDRLEKHAMVRRERRSRDRRKICLVLTDEGRKHLEALSPSLHDRFLARLLAMDEGERLMLLRSLRRVVDMIDGSNLDVAPILAAGDLTKDPSET